MMRSAIRLTAAASLRRSGMKMTNSVSTELFSMKKMGTSSMLNSRHFHMSSMMLDQKKEDEKSTEEEIKKEETVSENEKVEEETQKVEEESPAKNPFAFLDDWSDRLRNISFSSAIESAKENVSQAYREMIGAEKKSSLVSKVEMYDVVAAKKAAGVVDEEEEDEEAVAAAAEAMKNMRGGGNSIVMVQEGKSAWESMRDRLKDSPLMREILKKSRGAASVVGNTTLGSKASEVGTNVRDKLEDMREVWETSQNPIVYAVSGVWDNIVTETEEAKCIARFRALDPEFILENWAEEVKTELAPKLFKAHLSGDIKPMRSWLGEAVYNKLSADIRVRKEDGIYFDPNILDIEQTNILVQYSESEGPIIVPIYTVQQINCIRNKEGEILEGSESAIKANFYSMAFRQKVDDDTGVVKWIIIDYQFLGDMPYY